MPYATKDPSAKRSFGHDWTTNIGTEDITASTWTATPAGLTLTGSTFAAKTTSVFVEGGTDGTVYRLLNHVTLSGGGSDERTLRILARDA